MKESTKQKYHEQDEFISSQVERTGMTMYAICKAIGVSDGSYLSQCRKFRSLPDKYRASIEELPDKTLRCPICKNEVRTLAFHLENCKVCEFNGNEFNPMYKE